MTGGLETLIHRRQHHHLRKLKEMRSALEKSTRLKIHQSRGGQDDEEALRIDNRPKGQTGNQTTSDGSWGAKATAIEETL